MATTYSFQQPGPFLSNPAFSLDPRSFGGTGLVPPNYQPNQSNNILDDFGSNAGNFQFGMNMPTMRLGVGALQALTGLYGALQGNRLAKDQFNFTRDVTNTNLANQIQSYNTALEDRIRSRAVAEGTSQEAAEDYLNRNRLTR